MPADSDAFALASAHQQSGNLLQAERLFRQALEANPAHFEARYQLGKTVQALGRLDEAIGHFQRVLEVAPSFADAYSDLGAALASKGLFNDAAQTFQEALRRVPNNAKAANNLGVLYIMQGRAEEAAVYFRQAVQMQPANADYQRNLGNVLRDFGRMDDALACYQESLQLNPRSAATHNEFGTALLKLGKLEAAELHYRESLRLMPAYAQAHLGVGAALAHQQRFDEAIACYEQALHFKPDFAEAYNNLGNALLNRGQLEGAIRSYQCAVSLRPDLESSLLFCWNYDPETAPDAIFAAHCKWGKLQESAATVGKHSNERSPERRLRIGYVSPDLRRHAVMSYLEPVLANHDRAQIEVFCYAEVAVPDAVTARLQTLVDGWRWTCDLSDSKVADLIRSDGIDILIDLAGHSANNRLHVFAHKPAPIQATWLGYMNTTGLTRVDYRLTDEVLDPLGEPIRDTEELARIPGGMCCFAPPRAAPDVAPLPASRRGYLTFGSLHTLFKLNAGVFDVWSRVLHAIPNSRLLMFRNTLVGTARDHIVRQFQDRGIAGQRLDLRQGTSAEGYLAVYNEIDLTLDTFPCTGGVTTCESLWMGVPVLTLCGSRPAGRNSAALLTRVGLNDWIANTPEQYQSLAVAAAGDLDRLADLRAKLRQMMSATLCDAPRFTRQLEEAYRAMWRRWCHHAS